MIKLLNHEKEPELKNLLEGKFLKRRGKLLSILFTLSLLVAMLVPFAAPAAASTGYTEYSIPVTDDDTWS